MSDGVPWGMIQARKQADTYHVELDNSRKREYDLRHFVITAVDQALAELDGPRFSKKRLKMILSNLKTQIT